MREPGMTTQFCTTAPASITTSVKITDPLTAVAFTIDPAPTTEFCTEPPRMNFAGGRLEVSPRIGQWRL